MLAMHLCLVNEVRIHNFHINHFLIARRVHVRIASAYWRTVKFNLPYINRGPWVERKGKRERAIKITFNNFLQPAIEAWRAGKPYAQLICDISEFETDIIFTYTSLPHVHLGLSFFVRGYSSKSEVEVDIVHDTLHDSNEEDEIMIVFGYPYFPTGNP